MLARAIFVNMITEGEYLYNSYKGKRCDIGIIEIKNRNISPHDLAKSHNNSFVLVNIPEEVEALYNMVKYKHKLYEGDQDTYEITTPYIEKSWIIKTIDINKPTYELICFDKCDGSILENYFYTKYLLDYLDKHALDPYDDDYIYNWLGCINNYIAVTEFEKSIQQTLTHIVTVYLKERHYDKRKKHSDEYYNYFGEDATDDEIFDALSSPYNITEYLHDIILNNELNVINGSLQC